MRLAQASNYEKAVVTRQPFTCFQPTVTSRNPPLTNERKIPENHERSPVLVLLQWRNLHATRTTILDLFRGLLATLWKVKDHENT